MTSTTFVSAFMNIYNAPFQHRDDEWRFNHFHKLAKTGIRLVLIVSPEYKTYIEDFGYPNVTIIKVMELKDTSVYQTYKTVSDELGEQLELPNSRNPLKDTPEYILLMNAKTEFLKIAIELNIHESSHFAWIDFNIFHIFQGKERMATELLTGLSKRTMFPLFLTLPGCWGKEHVFDEYLINDICWRFCGGFFIGSLAQVAEFHGFYVDYFEAFLREKKKLVWEVNFWAYVEKHYGLSVIWYPADHNERILEISVRNTCLKLDGLPSVTVKKLAYPDHGEYIPTSTGYCYYQGEHIINTRYVNYWLYPNGGYLIRDPDGCIRTRNFYSRLNAEFEPDDFKEMVVNTEGENAISCGGGRIFGLEDVRIYENVSGKLCFVATSINYSGVQRNRIIGGDYNIDSGEYENSTVFVPPDPNSWCEKNWIPIECKGEDRFIYKWSPFEIGAIRDTEHGKQLVLDRSVEHNTPMFSNIRGSTTFVETAEGRVGVVHFSYEGGPRNYFHALVLLDREECTPLRYSEFFYFHNISVEFCIGFAIKDDKYHFWFSNFDRDPELMIVDVCEVPFLFDFMKK